MTIQPQKKIQALGFIIKETININEENEELNEEYAIRKYAELFNEERFWEAHEVLEKKSGVGIRMRVYGD
ncbi:DUF309 domain-containing protein [Vulcanisaeta sp. JCM 16159]|uniref:DUF309 domain-containing protein n=1 Tax=Vulcanisaeta sp. JCM 16159 TaxID=1295371 RepID=UPI003466AF31